MDLRNRALKARNGTQAGQISAACRPNSEGVQLLRQFPLKRPLLITAPSRGFANAWRKKGNCVIYTVQSVPMRFVTVYGCN